MNALFDDVPHGLLPGWGTPAGGLEGLLGEQHLHGLLGQRHHRPSLVLEDLVQEGEGGDEDLHRAVLAARRRVVLLHVLHHAVHRRAHDLEEVPPRAAAEERRRVLGAHLQREPHLEHGHELLRAQVLQHELVRKPARHALVRGQKVPAHVLLVAGDDQAVQRVVPRHELDHGRRGLGPVALAPAVAPGRDRVRLVDEDDAAVEVRGEEGARARDGLALVLRDQLGAPGEDEAVAHEEPGTREDDADRRRQRRLAAPGRPDEHQVQRLRPEDHRVLQKGADEVGDAVDDVHLRVVHRQRAQRAEQLLSERRGVRRDVADPRQRGGAQRLELGDALGHVAELARDRLEDRPVVRVAVDVRRALELRHIDLQRVDDAAALRLQLAQQVGVPVDLVCHVRREGALEDGKAALRRQELDQQPQPLGFRRAQHGSLPRHEHHDAQFFFKKKFKKWRGFWTCWRVGRPFARATSSACCRRTCSSPRPTWQGSPSSCKKTRPQRYACAACGRAVGSPASYRARPAPVEARQARPAAAVLRSSRPRPMCS